MGSGWLRRLHLLSHPLVPSVWNGNLSSTNSGNNLEIYKCMGKLCKFDMVRSEGSNPFFSITIFTIEEVSMAPS